MGERKVLNKYYPPDFDPSKIPRRKQPKNRQMTVRMMLPMSIRCQTCGNYIGKGTKFNSRKEDVVGENYLGIKVFRFYCKCTRCSAEITYKTDPRNSDYTVESGATRNFEPWRGADEEAEERSRKRRAEELEDPMKSLENRTFDSKREMDRDAALAEMMELKKKQATTSVDEVLNEVRKQREKDEAESCLQFRKLKEKMIIRRIEDDDEDDDDDLEHLFSTSPTSKKQKLGQGLSGNPTDVLVSAPKPLGRKIADAGASTSSSKGKKITLGSSTVVISEKKKKPPASDDGGLKTEDKNGQGKEVDCGGLQLIGAYGDDSEDYE